MRLLEEVDALHDTQVQVHEHSHQGQSDGRDGKGQGGGGGGDVVEGDQVDARSHERHREHHQNSIRGGEDHPQGLVHLGLDALDRDDEAGKLEIQRQAKLAVDVGCGVGRPSKVLPRLSHFRYCKDCKGS